MRSSGVMIILRWGLAFVFFYAAIASLAWPELWAVYVPPFITSVVSPKLFLSVFSAYELLLAGFLVWGRKLPWSSMLSAITFTIIVLADFRLMGIVFQSVGLAFSSLALFEMSRQTHTHHHNAPAQ